MKKVTLFGFIVLAAIVGVLFWHHFNDAEARFVHEATMAFEKHDVNRLQALYCWDRVSDVTKEKTWEANSNTLARTVIDIELVDPDPQYIHDWKVGGVTYAANLPVTKQLQVRFEPPEGSAPGVQYVMLPYNVGKKGGKLYLLSAAPVK